MREENEDIIKILLAELDRTNLELSELKINLASVEKRNLGLEGQFSGDKLEDNVVLVFFRGLIDVIRGLLPQGVNKIISHLIDLYVARPVEQNRQI